MIIGLYDADIITYTHVPFNLELMKLSSYYKNKRAIVGLSLTIAPEMYNKFIYRKDFYDGSFSPEILSNDKIVYGGRAFNRDKYIPLAEDIEKQKFDVSIYDKIKNSFCSNKWMTEAFKTLQRAEHFRLSLDGKTVWKDFEKQFNIVPSTQTLFLHDYNLNAIEDSNIAILDLMESMQKHNRNLAVKFPIQVNEEKDLFKWCNFRPSEKFFLLQYNGVMEDEVLKEFIEKQRNTSIARQFDYYITEDSNSEEDFIKNKLPIIYKQIVFLRMECRKINLKYNSNFFQDKQWEKLIDFFQAYLNSATNMTKEKFNKVIKYDSLYNYACHLQENPRNKNRNFSKQTARDLFQLVRQNNYEVFKDFYECHTVKLKGGKFQNE